MKNNFTSCLCAVIVCLCHSVAASAYDFTFNGLNYNIISSTDLTCEVTTSTVSGSFTVPKRAYYNDEIYTVVSIGERAFADCTNLTNVTISNNITTIKFNAFSGCSGLTKIVIPRSVSSIEGFLFYGCSKLASIEVASDNPVYDSRDNCNAIIETATNTMICSCSSTTIPSSVTAIGEKCFMGTEITSLVLPASVTFIGDYAFSYTYALQEVTIQGSNVSIGSNAFKGCGLKTISIMGSHISIGSNAFCNSGLQELSIMGSDISIGECAFENCTSLNIINIADVASWLTVNYQGVGSHPCGNWTSLYINGEKLVSVEIPAGLTEIKPYAFYNCRDIESITIPSTVTSIGKSAFSKSGITSISFPTSITMIGESAVEGCQKLTSIIVASDNPCYDSRDNCNAIIETATNTLIAGCQSSFIPSSVTTIGDNSFANCSQLTNITIPNSVTTIGDNSFSGCSQLTNVTIPNSVTKIGDSSFCLCSQLNSITIPNTITTIGKKTFMCCYKLSNINIPNSVTTIESGAFYCTGFTSFSIPNSVTILGSQAFAECYELMDITLPNTLTKIEDAVFANCGKLTAVDIPNTVTCIGERAFWQSGITRVTIPTSVTSIEAYAFSCCSLLEEVSIGDNVKSIGEGAFAQCRKLTNVSIPGSVTSIGAGAFGICSSLKTVTIGANVTSIGEWAFNACSSLEEITVGANVKQIGEYAFRECTAVTNLTSYAPIPPTCGANALTYIDKALCDLYVPEGSLEAYKSANQWKDFFFVFTTGLEDVKTNGINIKAQDGCIIVDGAPMGTAVAVYGTAGQCIYKGKQTRIQVPGHDTYIVKVGGMVRKLAM